MSEGNGHSRKLPKIEIADESLSPNEMIQEIWVDVKMLKIKTYGDKEKSIVGLTDEMAGLNNKIDTFIAEVKPLLEDRRFRKRIIKGLAWLVAGIGLKELSEYILTHYMK